jgi:hypothetical protein
LGGAYRGIDKRQRNGAGKKEGYDRESQRKKAFWKWAWIDESAGEDCQGAQGEENQNKGRTAAQKFKMHVRLP